MGPLRIAAMLGRFFLEGLRPVAAAPFTPAPDSWPDDGITGAWLGHSTVLINFLGVRILTDPVLAMRCGLRFGPLVIGPRRKVRPALEVRALPEVDLLLLSHAHMDHLDFWTVCQLRGRPHAVTAAGMADLLEGMPVASVTSLGWDQSAIIETARGSVTVTARKVAHWGARMRNDDWRGYCGFTFARGGRTLGFAGDTARTDFTHWSDGAAAIDLMAIPIGAYNPWATSHCNPEEAVAMADEARARLLLPVHHATFKLSAEPMDEPVARFRAAVPASRIAASQIGETFRVAL